MHSARKMGDRSGAGEASAWRGIETGCPAANLKNSTGLKETEEISATLENTDLPETALSRSTGGREDSRKSFNLFLQCEGCRENRFSGIFFSLPFCFRYLCLHTLRSIPWTCGTLIQIGDDPLVVYVEFRTRFLINDQNRLSVHLHHARRHLSGDRPFNGLFYCAGFRLPAGYQ